MVRPLSVPCAPSMLLLSLSVRCRSGRFASDGHHSDSLSRVTVEHSPAASWAGSHNAAAGPPTVSDGQPTAWELVLIDAGEGPGAEVECPVLALRAA